MAERKERPTSERKEIKYGSEAYKALKTLGEISGSNFHGSIYVDDEDLDRGLRSDSDNMPKGYMGKEQIDGFNFSIFADILVLKYHSDVTTKEIHQGGKGKFEEKVKDTMRANMNFIKKKFKSISDKELIVKSIDEPKIVLEYMNTHRSWIIAEWRFRVSNLKEFSNEELTPEQNESLYGIKGGESDMLEESFDLRSWIISAREDREKAILDD